MGLIWWQLWLEHNNIIFKEEFGIVKRTWGIIRRKLLENIEAKFQIEPQMILEEQVIWAQIWK